MLEITYTYLKYPNHSIHEWSPPSTSAGEVEAHFSKVLNSLASRSCTQAFLRPSQRVAKFIKKIPLGSSRIHTLHLAPLTIQQPVNQGKSFCLSKLFKTEVAMYASTVKLFLRTSWPLEWAPAPPVTSGPSVVNGWTDTGVNNV